MITLTREWQVIAPGWEARIISTWDNGKGVIIEVRFRYR